MPLMEIEQRVIDGNSRLEDDDAPELTVHAMDYDKSLWEEGDAESGGLVHFDGPEEGKMLRVNVTGEVLVYIGPGGKMVIDRR